MSEKSSATPPQQENKHTLGWIFGVLFLIGGLGMFTESFLTGLTTTLVGLVILPPSRKWLEQKLNRTLSRPILIVISVILLAIGGVGMPDTTATTTNTNTVVQENEPTPVEQVTPENTPEEQAVPVEAPKEETITDKLWKALDASIKSRDGYDVQWEEEKGTAKLIRTKDTFWDENSLVRDTYTDFVKYGREVFQIEGVNRIEIEYMAPFTDSFGNESNQRAVGILMTKEEFQKFNWDNLNYQPVYQQIQDHAVYQFIHPAIMKDTSEDKLFLSI